MKPLDTVKTTDTLRAPGFIDLPICKTTDGWQVSYWVFDEEEKMMLSAGLPLRIAIKTADGSFPILQLEVAT